jgi:1-acyl-sn-glycerol-3-phosphate acyltransferase
MLFTVFMLLIFPFVVISSFFGKMKGGNFIYTLCQLWADIVLGLCGIFHKNIYLSPHDRSKQYVFVVNHISYMDIPVIIKALRNQHFRILGKYEISKVPIFGFIYKNAVVMVERDSARKRAKSVQQLKSVIQKGISIVLFPEGTFNETHQPLKQFYDGAFRIAIETQTPVKPILFLDNYDRLNYRSFLSLTPGRSRAIYLDEIKVDGLTIKDISLLKERVYKVMEEKLISYKASWINSTLKK